MNPFQDLRSPGRPPVLPEKVIERIRSLARGMSYAAVARAVASEFGCAVTPEYCSLVARGMARKKPAPR